MCFTCNSLNDNKVKYYFNLIHFKAWTIISSCVAIWSALSVYGQSPECFG